MSEKDKRERTAYDAIKPLSASWWFSWDSVRRGKGEPQWEPNHSWDGKEWIMPGGEDATIFWESRDRIYLTRCMPQWPERCPVVCELLGGRRVLRKDLLNEDIFAEGPASQLTWRGCWDQGTQWWLQLGEQVSWGHLPTLLTLGHLVVSVSELKDGISWAFSLPGSLIHETLSYSACHKNLEF